jgi:hypothetical protein
LHDAGSFLGDSRIDGCLREWRVDSGRASARWWWRIETTLPWFVVRVSSNVLPGVRRDTNDGLRYLPEALRHELLVRWERRARSASAWAQGLP